MPKPKLCRESGLSTPRGRQVQYDTEGGGVWLIAMGRCALWVLGGVILAAHTTITSISSVPRRCGARCVPKLYRESGLGTPRGRQVQCDTEGGGAWLAAMGRCALWVLSGIILAAPLQTAGASVADIYIIDHAGAGCYG